MTRSELTAAVDAVMSETRDALRTVMETLNQGQRKKLIRDERIRALLERYGVNTDE